MAGSLRTLVGMKVQAIDGEVGSVEEFYFEDHSWIVRYMVVSVGRALQKRLVLVSPFLVEHIDSQHGHIKVRATKSQIESSPDHDTAKPISREREEQYAKQINTPLYWLGPYAWGPFPFPAEWHFGDVKHDNVENAEKNELDAKTENKLRSSEEVRGYGVSAFDEVFGEVEDMVVDMGTWTIRYLVIDPVNWWPGKNVMVSTKWIDAVSWAAGCVVTSLTRGEIEACPPFDKTKLDHNYESELHHQVKKNFDTPPLKTDKQGSQYRYSGDVEFETRD